MNPREALLELIQVDPNRGYSASVDEFAHPPAMHGQPHKLTARYTVTCQPGIEGAAITSRDSSETMLAAFSELRSAIIRENARIHLAMVHPLEG